MSDEPLDLDATHYSKQDLLYILNLIDKDSTDSDYTDMLQDITREDIVSATDSYINKYTSENNDEMSNFFKQIQTILLNDIDNSLTENNNIIQTDNQTDIENENETITRNNITDGPIKFSRYSDGPNELRKRTDGHSLINQETQHVVNTFAPPAVKGNLNPLLKNTYSCFINIDSKYRQFTNSNTETDFTLDLSAPLKNLLSLQLYSYQIPISWYVINSNIGNTCFWIEDPSTNTIVRISIEQGNYTPESLVVELNEKIVEAGFYNFPTIPFVYDTRKGKIIFKLFKGVYRKSDKDIFTISIETKIIFFDFNFSFDCDTLTCGLKLPTYINNTLGWLMGFRLPIVPILTQGNIPISILDLFGTKYFLIVIDDFNSNRLNNSLITITEFSTKLSFPEYYTSTLPKECLSELNNTEILEKEFENSNNGLLFIEKLEIINQSVPQVVPTAPRTLTQSQIYTINEISKNRLKSTNVRSKPPNRSDSFAIIPIKKGSMPLGDVYCDFGGSLQENKRRYFGPVNISRLTIKLINDKGYLVDLHGGEWAITLICEELYQY